jgi:hypothetical protein
MPWGRSGVNGRVDGYGYGYGLRINGVFGCWFWRWFSGNG